MKEMHRILKFSNLESSTPEKVVLFCVRRTDFFIGCYIYFTKLIPISSKYEDLFRQA